MIQLAVSRNVYASTLSNTSPDLQKIREVLDTSGDNPGVLTPAGSALPSSDSRYEIPWRATCTSTPSAKVMVTTESPGIDSERIGIGNAGRTVHGVFDLPGDQLFHLLGSEPGRFRLDVNLRRHKLGKYIERRLHRPPTSQHQRHQSQRGDRAVVAHAQRNE